MANQKISQLNSLTKATVASADVLPIVDTSASETKKISYQELVQPTDANFRIAGSADNTKLVAFEVDGLTTATTRTVTIPDANTTMVGTDATQTLTNKTLTSPQVNMGSDATGDMYYRNGSGVTSRLPIGSTDQILAVTGGLPVWTANPSAANGSYTTKGVLQGLTDAATSGLTISSGVVNVNSGTGANQIVKLDASAKLPAVDGSQLTNIASTYANGVTSKNAADASTTQNIAHGLGRTPKFVKITFVETQASAVLSRPVANGVVVYNGTTQSGISTYSISGGNMSIGDTTNNFRLNTSNLADSTNGVITVTSTNILITWTKTGSPTGTYGLVWEAFG